MRADHVRAVLASLLVIGCSGTTAQAVLNPPEDASPDQAAPSPADAPVAPDVPVAVDVAAPDARVVDAAIPDRAPPDSAPPDLARDLAPPDAPPPDAPPADVAAPDTRDAAFVWQDATCALATVRPEKLPYDLYVMLDASLSMYEDTAAGEPKWDAVRRALNAFVAQSQTAGLGFGLQYFPLFKDGVPSECYADGDCGNAGPCKRARTCAPADTVTLCDDALDCGAGQTCELLGACTQSPDYCTQIGAACSAGGGNCLAIPGYCRGRDVCDSAAYATPAVAIAPLPGVGAAITASLAAKVPDGLSPIGPALAGALAQARARIAADPTRRAAVILVSDGFPVECAPTGIGEVAALAEAAARGTPAVPTFAIGVFSPAEVGAANANLGAIARAGGTAKPFGITTGQDVTQAFLAALNEISVAALACEYRIPAAMTGQIDFAKVNVQFTAGDGALSNLGYVGSQARCDPSRGGWYYDVDPAAGTPTRIFTCSTSCSGLRADPKGQVDLVFGCRTETGP
jgi:hypothetical protein